MSQCPFHGDSAGTSHSGEIESIHCATCGDYRISRTALQQLRGRQAPADWLKMIARRALISTRDTRVLV